MSTRAVPLMEGLPEVAVDLACGLGTTGNLEAAGDLDNFLVPVMDALDDGRIVSAWASKDGGATSTLAVGPPQPITLTGADGWRHARVRTRASGGSLAWKQEIAIQVASVEPLPTLGHAELIVAYTVGPGRAWVNLWKPSIDALGRILGPGPRQWHPRDGRIVRLGLTVETDRSLGWDVLIDLWWRQSPRRG